VPFLTLIEFKGHSIAMCFLSLQMRHLLMVVELDAQIFVEACGKMLPFPTDTLRQYDQSCARKARSLGA
jgi:hypothetical protein